VTVKGGESVCETAKTETGGDFDLQRLTSSVSWDVLHADNSERPFQWMQFFTVIYALINIEKLNNLRDNLPE
jgi:hypothetical protein